MDGACVVCVCVCVQVCVKEERGGREGEGGGKRGSIHLKLEPSSSYLNMQYASIARVYPMFAFETYTMFNVYSFITKLSL